MKYSAIDQLLIFFLFVIGSIISSIIQNKKKAEEQRKAGGLPPPSPAPLRPRHAGEMPVPPWPSTAKSWQEEVRRILEGQRPPQGVPPKVPAKTRPTPPVTGRTSVPPELSEGELAFDSPLRQSNTAYKLAAQLDEKVAARLQQIEKQTETARPAPFVRPGSTGPQPSNVRALLASTGAVRNAFVASLIFGPPASLDSQDRF